MTENFDTNHKMSDRRANADRRIFNDPDYKGTERRISQDRRKGQHKRKHKRYQVKDLSRVKLRSEAEVDIGQILDISEGGLSFQYVANHEKPKNYSTFGISATDPDFFSIKRIPFKTISDIDLTDKSPASRTKRKRHSIKFDKLTSRQMFKIEHFLQNILSAELDRST